MDDQNEGLARHACSEGVDVAEGGRDDAGGDLVQLLCEVDVVLFHHYCLGGLSKNSRFILND
jgi:hypothetical protein